MFAIFDSQEDAAVDLVEFKQIAKQLHENLTDDDILEMIHSTHINHKTGSNDAINF